MAGLYVAEAASTGELTAPAEVTRVTLVGDAAVAESRAGEPDCRSTTLYDGATRTLGA